MWKSGKSLGEAEWMGTNVVGNQTTTSLPSCFPPSRWRQRRLVRPSPRLKPRPSRQGVAAYTARRPEGGAIELCVGLVMGSVASKLQDSRANSLPVFPPSLTRLRKTSSANSTRLRRRSPCTCCPRRHVPWASRTSAERTRRPSSSSWRSSSTHHRSTCGQGLSIDVNETQRGTGWDYKEDTLRTVWKPVWRSLFTPRVK